MKSKKAKRLIVLAVVIIVMAGSCFSLYALMNSRTFMFFGTIADRGPADEKTLYLTFDDGPTDSTPDILKMLDELGVKATFFLIGREMEAHKDYVRQILQGGHGIGNHSYTHQRMIFLPLSTIRDEVENTNAMIRDAGYDGEIFFRMPNCKKLFLLPWYLSQTGQCTVTWSIEPESDKTASKSAGAMAEYAAERFEPGAIILLHPMGDKTDKTNEAIRLIVQAARKQGYSFKTLADGFK